MALSPKLIGPAISSITGLITSTSMSFVGLALNYPARFRHALAESRDNELRRGRANVDRHHPADSALRHAAGRIAGALRSSHRTTRNPRRKPGRQFLS